MSQKKNVFIIISAKSPSILVVPEEAETVEVVAQEEEEEDYVPDEELLAAEEQIPQPPPLPLDSTLESAEDDLAACLHGRPPLARHLGRGKYAVLSSFQGVLKLHIREFGTNNLTLKKFPTSKGVCLDHVQVRALIHHAADIRTRVHNPGMSLGANWHLGRLIFASFNPEFGCTIDLRHFFVPESRLQATRKGISLNKRELDNLISLLTPMLESRWPSLQVQNQPCFVEHEQHNDEERAKAQCPYCSPLIGL